jgi:nicotinamidase-related amidase
MLEKGSPIMPNVNILEADLAALVVIDVQEKMLSAITTSPTDIILDKIRRLIGVAKVLDVPVVYTEQYPQGLGPTNTQVKAWLPPELRPVVKTTCSCWRDQNFRNALQATGREHIILAGLETHVCVQQTALDLLRVDYSVFVPVDAVGSRFTIDMDTSVARMRHAGVEISTTESLIFDLVERCDHPKFKDVLRIIK